MNIIFFTKRGRRYQFNIGHLPGFLLASALTILVTSAITAAGYFLAVYLHTVQPDDQIASLKNELTRQKTELNSARRTAQEDIGALSVRLGQLHAHIMRLDALGERLTKMAGLQEGEFDFGTDPAQGGPEIFVEGDNLPTLNFIQTLDNISAQIADREKQLAVLENLLMNRNLQNQVRPAGRPVKSGWISSYFGVRTDPFTGRPARHYGIDFAGTLGAEIIAVAAGVVTWAGPRYGYGQLVEINHGNGYATRYAHNQEILVKVGDTVKKGQMIAQMGSSGRSTGPHVHFEVLYNGKVVNPLSYIKP
ncbi:MAG: M23 family metallopeptidase [Gammaproteobacteria bacterium]|nr:M23 family metallopeptidase [Gammaproteobacteria bacterium]